jgi:ketosteroid isomerase-like protein
MSDESKLRDLDRTRRQAMVAADVATLTELLADSLMWVHATARTDTKAGLLQAIASGATRYLSIDVSEESYRQFGDVALLSGLAAMRLEVGGAARDLENRYTIVWHRRDADWQVVNWQSTAVRRPA